jgi:spermidine/putrescine transport system substrate-binding protein
MPSRNPRRARPISGVPLLAGATRRRFLQLSSAALSGIVLSNCAQNLANVDNPSEEAGEGEATASAEDNVLYIYSWANYTDDQLLENFKAKTGIQVVVDTYDSNETMLAKMQAGGGSAYSIIFPSDYMVTQMVELGMLASLDKSRLNGLDALKQPWQNPVYDPNNEHSIPTSWGTTGFIYNPDILGADLEGWDYLLEETDALNRKVTLLNDVREVMGAILRYLGYSYNSEDPAEIEEAYNVLVEMKPAIANFITNGWEDQLASGDLLISMAYSVDAIYLMAETPGLKYVVPKTGSSLWTDTMVIPSTAPNVDAAYEWLNFMLEPDNAAQVVTRLKFATPNQAAYELLPTDVKDDTNLFPPEEILANCEGIAPLSQDANETFDRYWTQLTSA